MRKDQINRLIRIRSTTLTSSNQLYSLWLLMTYYSKSLTTDELFSFIPLIWEVDVLHDKYFGIRQKLEREIKERQNSETVLNLIELLKSDNVNLRFFAADLLKYFKDEKIIEPILTYLKNTTDDFMIKREAIFVLRNYNDEIVIQYLREEIERNKNNQDVFFINNYFKTLEWILEKNTEGIK